MQTFHKRIPCRDLGRDLAPLPFSLPLFLPPQKIRRIVFRGKRERDTGKGGRGKVRVTAKARDFEINEEEGLI